jgi:hypothetical protein
MVLAAPEWARARVAHGLATGEGLISEVRDPVEERATRTRAIPAWPTSASW